MDLFGDCDMIQCTPLSFKRARLLSAVLFLKEILLNNVHSVSMTDKKTAVLLISIFKFCFSSVTNKPPRTILWSQNGDSAMLFDNLCWSAKEHTLTTYTHAYTKIINVLKVFVQLKAGTLLQVDLKKGLFFQKNLAMSNMTVHQAVNRVWYSCDSHVHKHINTSTPMSKYYIQYFKIYYQETVVIW